MPSLYKVLLNIQYYFKLELFLKKAAICFYSFKTNLNISKIVYNLVFKKSKSLFQLVYIDKFYKYWNLFLDFLNI